MKRILLLLILQIFLFAIASSQSFTINDLLKLATLPSKDVNHFINKSGFILASQKSDTDTLGATFIPNAKVSKKDITLKRSIDMYIKDNAKCILLHTSSLNEYIDGQRRLIKEHFFYDDKKDVTKEASMLFQKANITIQTTSDIVDGIKQYTFHLKEVQIPDSVIFAEELLQFDSHEYLSSFFGEQNVKKDMYYFSEKELKKCSVLFSGTRRQAVFVWGDENTLSNLSYILITNTLPTEGARLNNPLTGNNEWQFKNGIHAGMPLKDLLRINEMDFDIYGNESELAFMVKPEETGKINFKKTAVMLACSNCFDDNMFKQKVVSALDVAKANLPMRVYDVIIYPR